MARGIRVGTRQAVVMVVVPSSAAPVAAVMAMATWPRRRPESGAARDATGARRPYAMQGAFLEVCDCWTICPCWTGRGPDEDVCTGVFAWVIEDGRSMAWMSAG